jgi:amino acid adenylation domain-containing protein
MSDLSPTSEIGGRIAAMSPAQRALLRKRLAARQSVAVPPIARRGDAEPSELSFGQELLWLLDRATPGSSAYNIPLTFSLTGGVDVRVLERTLEAIVERHDVFRTTFAIVDGGASAIVGTASAVTLDVIDADGPEEAGVLRREIGRRARRPFDLAAEAPFRATLFRLGRERNVLLVVTHHIAFDGLSAGVLLRELAGIYGALADRRPIAPRLAPIGYRDYAAWQRAQLTGTYLDELLGYWRNALAGVTQLAIPTDRPRAHVQSSEGAEASTVLPPQLFSAIREFAQARRATVYMLLLAAYAALLSRYTGQDDVVIGSPVAGRTRDETEHVIGYFTNTLPLRIDASGDPSFDALLERARGVALDALEHQDVPLEKLIMDLRRGDFGDTALFRCVLTMQDGVPTEALPAGGVQIALRPVEPGVAQTSKFDLVLMAGEEGTGLRLTLHYRTDLFDAGTASRLLGHLRTVLEAAIERPDAPVSTLPLLDGAEVVRTATWNATQTHDPYASVVATFDAAARRVPDAQAFVSGRESLTYRELRRRADAFAQHLRARGVRPGDAVAICLDPSADMIVALLGTLKARAAYVAAPPDFGAIRIATYIADSAARFVVSSAKHAALSALADVALIDIQRVDLAADGPGLDDPSSGDLAYILYTSGSTGEPKGVAVTHGNIANYARAILRVLAEDGVAASSFATASTLGADLGNTAIFGALTSGATLHLIPADIATDAQRFARYMNRHAIDVLKITPSHADALVAALGDRAHEIVPRSCIVLGGEALPWALVDTLERIGSARIVNHYGPTETTVGCSTYLVRSQEARANSGTVPIGRPLDNMQLHVLDRNRQPVPVGITGELYVAGSGVAAGYVGRPAETAERFVELAGIGRAYRTGDRVRRLPSGDIVFLGRSDRQVKIRGFRVELDEIEAHLASHPEVRAAAVLISSVGNGRLTAFVARASRSADADSGEAALAMWLASRLPAHMRPQQLRVLDSLPLTANGKVDYAALATADQIAPLPVERVPPRSPLEQIVAAVWSETLKNDRIGATENFFDLGGDSLLAVRTLGRLSRRLGMRIPLRALIDAPTVETFAALISQPQAFANTTLPYLAFNPSAPTTPLFFLHGDLAGNGLYVAKLAEQLGADRPLYALHPIGMTGEPMPPTIEGMAAAHIADMRALQPHGPYSLAGYCNGGIVAFEIAQQLRVAGEVVRDLILLSSTGTNARFGNVDRFIRAVASTMRISDPDRIGRGAAIRCLYRCDDLLRRSAAIHPKLSGRTAYAAQRVYRMVASAARGAIERMRSRGDAQRPEAQLLKMGDDRLDEWIDLRMRYVPRKYDGKMTHIVGSGDLEVFDDESLGWRRVATGIEVRITPGAHGTYLTGHLDELADSIKRSLS